jgi:8-oxo-dGTP diphosphatase
MSVAQPNNQSTATNPVGRFMVAVGAIIQHERTGKILIIRRANTLDWQPGEWETLYGRIDQHEDAQQGLAREVSEEIGLHDLVVKNILTTWHIYRGPKKAENDLIGITYHAVTDQDAITLSNEHSEYAWVTPEEALQKISIEGIKRDVNAFINQRSSATSSRAGIDHIGVGVGALIFNKEGKILLALRSQHAKNERGTWEIPGGAIAFGETLHEGLKREMREELGIEIEVGEMVQLCDHIISDEKQHWVSPTYKCVITKGTPTILEPEKCDDIGWFTLDEAEKLPLSIVTRQDISFLRNKKSEQ